MSEKYYVVSESELEELFACAFRRARLISAGILDVKDDLVKAEAACRARPVYYDYDESGNKVWFIDEGDV